MAAVVKCDICGKIVKHTNASHLRTYKLTDATSFDGSRAILAFDICHDCSSNLKKLVEGGSVPNAKQATTETPT